MSQVSFASWFSLPSYSEQRKFESTTLPLPLFNSFPPRPHSVGQSADCLTPFGYLPCASGQGNIIALTRGRSPSINENTYILEDRPRGPCILVSLTSSMSSLDHLRGVLSASRDGLVSHARLQPHHRTIEIHTGDWSIHYLVEYHGFHLTLAHW